MITPNRLYYDDMIALRDLAVEIDGNEAPEDKLRPPEVIALGKLHVIIAAMEQKRRDEDAGIVLQYPWKKRRGAR